VFTLLTQNVDRLHQQAGSRGVVELHGTIIDWRCTATGRRVTPGPAAMERFPAPSPHAEGAFLRPDVVWFGEALPEEAVAAAASAAEGCDLFVSVGTSAVVYPAAGFIQVARAHGALTAEVNAEATPISGVVDCTVRGRAAAALPGVVERV
jgi:NAD-dependent SIR2 family protein deacetylase